MNNIWPVQSINPYDAMDQDALLMRWDALKKAVEAAKEQEMELRKYIVTRAFPNADEGTNTIEFGNGYKLKAVVRYTYKLADNKTVTDVLQKIGKLGNEGEFVADRLVSWTPNFLKSEFTKLQEEASEGSKFAADTILLINEMLTISNAAPTLDIVEPKKKK